MLRPRRGLRVSEGRIYRWILEESSRKGTLHFTLIDPDKVSPSDIDKIVKFVSEIDTDAILVGGSTGVDQESVDFVVKSLKESGKPIILFPGSIAGVSKYADALLFLSVLNSENPYFIVGVQAMAAVLLRKKYPNLETISTAYIIMGRGETVGYVSYARPIPYDKPGLALAYALAAEYIGFKAIYLEGGSGAKEPIPPEVIKLVTSNVKIPVFVGGGIRTCEAACNAAKAGATAIVTGTLFEKSPELLPKIIRCIRECARERVKQRA